MELATISKCDGRCCAVFPLHPDITKACNVYRFGEDGPKIRDMVLPLTLDAAGERIAKFELNLPLNDGPYFTCRFWDDRTGLCLHYEARPNLCSRYPSYGDGYACKHCGWTGEGDTP